ncbi:MFS transporter [Aeromicrobium phragmitis]|uniref:MFS transporter n=1 Tax=Aeromicrobium phragmitis TaxID=2478914 RepID=A0A3L8PP28_9ACTN|nr:MFS transporter [Aeromicrobium phragmitis]RLV57175.1 MFS transporter [Aeromicrobium phragmitis]
MSLRARFLTILALRWLATGLIIPVSVLLPLSRGLSVTEIGLVTAAQGVVVLVLEIPSGALSDSWGRRQVLIASAIVAVTAYVIAISAQDVLAFAASWAMMGIFRALDSGPLEAWFVDAERARGAADEVPRGLAHAGTVMGVAIAAGSLASGGLVFVADDSDVALAVPYVAAIAVTLAQVVAALVVMDRVPAADRSERKGWARTLTEGVGLVSGPALRWFAVAMVFSGIGVSALEMFLPVRLDEFSGDTAAAGAAMGPVAAGAWAVGGAGSAVVARVLRHRSAASLAPALVAMQAIALLGMAVAGTPTLLVGAFWAAYAVHLGFGASFNSLVHERVDDAHRATALSVTSMAFLGSGAAGGIGLGALSDAVPPRRPSPRGRWPSRSPRVSSPWPAEPRHSRPSGAPQKNREDSRSLRVSPVRIR